MATKTKKIKHAGRFGAGYGKRVRKKLIGVESKQRIKQTCPFCSRKPAKRTSKGIWECKKCGKKFAHNTFHLGDS
ncbi:MAG: 50S ribosomal protein L37ae [archaeon]